MAEPSGLDELTTLKHDLANLLMMVRGYAELMLIDDALNPSLRHYPEQIVQVVDRATSRLNDLHPTPPATQSFPRHRAEPSTGN